LLPGDLGGHLLADHERPEDLDALQLEGHPAVRLDLGLEEVLAPHVGVALLGA
jgi:hypothetical protein